MKVLIISTTERTGGGAIAAKRLLTALNKNGIQAKMLVRDKQSNDANVVAYGNILPKVIERLRIMFALLKPLRKTWQYDFATDGVDILSTKEYQEADVIHLHWVNQGMLSLRQLYQMMLSGKQIVWTLHDEWPFRGIRHYTDEADGTSDSRVELLEKQLFDRKQSIYAQGRISFVGCSQWIADLAHRSMPCAKVYHVNNCIPQEIFCPMDMHEARKAFALPLDKQLILFSCQKVTDKRKGMSYLLNALKYLHSPKPHLVIVGGNADELSVTIGGVDKDGMHFIPYVNGENEMARLYSAVDCFVTPSLQDNLPNTIAEAMSCGTPCVGFDAGGIPEMITHMQNGYVAKYCDSKDLAFGIETTLAHPQWRHAALSKAKESYNEQSVAQQYTKLYEIL